ncbi:uncharacterized protein LOC143203700 isoform X2 [Rhynchophorus ferrugineus]|uniref:uncharacterized protein LOC143203700 isoform X2 n=1 Tax=Rhynchophorus ferrugineus TaxID=354439 RepID=UPI003FCE7B48
MRAARRRWNIYASGADGGRGTGRRAGSSPPTTSTNPPELGVFMFLIYFGVMFKNVVECISRFLFLLLHNKKKERKMKRTINVQDALFDEALS